MHNDQKRGIRIIAERVSVTTIRTRSKKIYCETCGRQLRADEMHLGAIVSTARNVTESARSTDVEKGEEE